MDFIILTPEILVCFTALMIIAYSWFIPQDNNISQKQKNEPGYISLIGLFIALCVLIAWKIAGFSSPDNFWGTFIADKYSWFLRTILLIAAIITILLSFNYVNDKIKYPTEFYSLLLLAILGTMLMSSAGEMISLYLAVELTSITSYVLVGFRREKLQSSEASLKYIVIGAISSGLMLYGMSIILGITGLTDFQSITMSLLKNNNYGTQPLLNAPFIAMILIICGLGYKISIVPFHMWTPDVYEGAPLPITAFLSVSSKIAGFAAILRILDMFSFSPIATDEWVDLIAILALLTMTLGNVVALVQKNIKRMLAYSGIAHAGYLLVGIVALATPSKAPLGMTGILYYMLAYIFMNLGAFAAIIYFARQTGSTQIIDFTGLSKKSPWISFALSCCLISLAGLPPFAGFTGKFYLFSAAINVGYVWLALVGVLNSVISLYYYVRIIKYMYFGNIDETKIFINPNPEIVIALLISVVGILSMFIFAGPIIQFISNSTIIGVI